MGMTRKEMIANRDSIKVGDTVWLSDAYFQKKPLKRKVLRVDGDCLILKMGKEEIRVHKDYGSGDFSLHVFLKGEIAEYKALDALFKNGISISPYHDVSPSVIFRLLRKHLKVD